MTRPARSAAGKFKTEEQLEAFRADYGLDQPLAQQFLTYLKNTLQGDLGVSYRYRVPVSDLILDRMWPTLLLVGIATILSAVIGVYLGVISAWNRGRPVDKVTTGTTLTLYSMPEWWLGLLLIAAFGVGMGPLPGIFPTGGLHSVDAEPGTPGYVADTAWHLVLPVLTLTLVYLADFALIMRSSLLDEIGEDYLTTARAKGLRDVGRTPAARDPQRAAADDHPDRAVDRLRGLRRHHGRDGLLDPRPGSARDRGADDPRLLGAAGHVPGDLGRGRSSPTWWPT